MNRRKLVTVALNGTGLLIAGVVGTPVFLNAVSPALEPRLLSDWHRLGPLQQFPMGQVETIAIGHRGIFVWRRDEEQVVVFSRACTDLGCPVTWDSGSTWFYCPCHGGIFDQEGNPVAGPPKIPLWRYAVRISDSHLEIDLMSVPPMV